MLLEKFLHIFRMMVFKTFIGNVSCFIKIVPSKWLTFILGPVGNAGLGLTIWNPPSLIIWTYNTHNVIRTLNKAIGIRSSSDHKLC